MPPWLSALVSLIFLAAGAIAVYLMLRLQGKGDADNYQALSRYHRLSGWLFGILFIVMFIVMLARVGNVWEESSPRIAIHATLAIGLLFLVLIKMVIPRFFNKLNKHLFLLGIFIYLTAFTMVWITTGYYYIWRYKEEPYISHAELPEQMLDTEIGKQLFIDKCSVCHMLENIMAPRSQPSWEITVNRMVEIASPRIAPSEGGQILHYLSETHTPKPAGDENASPLQKYCLPCHQRKDIRGRTYSRRDWQELVEEMRGYGPDIIPKDKTSEIVKYLSGIGSTED